MAVDDVLGPGEMRARVVHVDGSARILVCGELDLATAPQLWAASAEAAARVPPGSALILDTRRLDFLDAAGIGVIVRLRNRVRSQGAHLRVEGASPAVRRVFELTELEQLLGGLTPEPARARI